MFFREESRKYIRRNRLYIVDGLQAGAGVTHLSTSLCAYFSSYLKLKTAYVELAEHSALMHILTGRGELINGAVCFRYKGINYYPCAKAEQLSVIRADYQVVVADCAEVNSEDLTISDVERTFLLSNMEPWHIEDVNGYFMRYMSGSTQTQKGWQRVGTVFSRSVNKRDRDRFTEEYKIPVRYIPDIDDPFFLSSKDTKYLKGII